MTTIPTAAAQERQPTQTDKAAKPERELLRVDIDRGKYTVIQEAAGNMRFLRNGEPWPAADEAFAHVGMILALAQDLATMRERADSLYTQLHAELNARRPSRSAAQ